MAKFKVDPEMLGDSATMKDAQNLAAWLSRHGYDTEAVSDAGSGGPSIPDAVFYKGMAELFNTVRNAKFKKGDKVTDGNAVYEITDVDDGVYKWRPVGGKGDPSYSEGGEVEWAEHKMRLANSAPVSANSVVRNAMAARTAKNATQEDVMVKACANECGKARSILDDWRDHARILAGDSKKFARAKPEFDKAYAALVAAMNIVGA